MATVDQFIDKMKTQLGVRYTWGGESPSEGFDCSGIIMWALQQLGISYPHQSGQIIVKTKAISVSDALKTKGALLYFPGHIATSLGNGQILEAPQPGGVVRIVNNYGGWTQAGVIPELTTKPIGGFLMALSDSDQQILFNRVKNILEELTLGSGQHLVETVYTQMKESRDVLTGQTGKPGRYNGPDQLKNLLNVLNETQAAVKKLAATIDGKSS